MNLCCFEIFVSVEHTALEQASLLCTHLYYSKMVPHGVYHKALNMYVLQQWILQFTSNYNIDHSMWASTQLKQFIRLLGYIKW